MINKSELNENQELPGKRVDGKIKIENILIP